MKKAFFSPASGVSGDMILGALVDCGVPREAIEDQLRRLPLSGWSLEVSSVMRNGLRGTHVQVSVPHEHVHRHLSDIRRIIEDSSLDAWVKEKSVQAFTLLAQAEARCHGVDVEEVHFHEVGAMDAILDVVGSFAGLHILGVTEVHSGPIALGTGTVECAHGTMPVPVPAVVRLVEGLPVIRTTVPFELTTPTGAAILKAAVDHWTFSTMTTGRVSGMGAGSRDLPGRSNLLGLVVGDGKIAEGGILVLEAVLDDMEPRLWPSLSASLLTAGAVDCWCTQSLGRKGRPALCITVLLSPSDRMRVLDVLFRESTTLGVRESIQDRVVLDREFRSVETPWGAVRVKLGVWKGKVVNSMPEYEDCRALAESAGIPVKRVLDCARGLASEHLDG